MFRTIGNHFVLNIVQPENTPAGIFVVNRDPRKYRVKPDVYIGIVEDAGGACQLVRPGMKVVVKRWEYRQHDLDDERIVASEKELLILDEKTPAPGVVVLKLEDQKPKTTISLPETYTPKKQAVHIGVVEALNIHPDEMVRSFGEKICIGDLLWVERRERDQFFQGGNRLVFKNTPDVWNGDSPILMIGKKVPALQVI